MITERISYPEMKRLYVQLRHEAAMKLAKARGQSKVHSILEHHQEFLKEADLLCAFHGWSRIEFIAELNTREYAG
jgi:hypothetical protein